MAIETQYNIVKVNELRPITVAQAQDEIVINDSDSFPLETKKISVKNLADSMKEYILPIAGEGPNGVLGGVKIGDGLDINPITGLLSSGVLILDDLQDVIILNPEAGHVLRYNGVQWINEPEGGITNIIAGDGLSGGGYEGEVQINANAGPGLIIENDSLKVNVNAGLEIVNDKINVRINPGLTFSDNSITLVPGNAMNVSGGKLNFVPSLGIELLGPGAKVDEGYGLTFEGNNLIVDVGAGITKDGNKVTVQDGTFLQKGINKFAPLVDSMSDIRGTESYTNDQINPAFVDNLKSLVPPGAVFFFAGFEVPEGYLFCNGSVVTQIDYPDLALVIGTTYNTGLEGPGEFRLPDLRNEFIRGATTNLENPQPLPGVRRVGSVQTDKLKMHVHPLDPEDPITGALVAPGQWAQNMMMMPTRWGFAQIGTMPIMMGGGGGPDFFTDTYYQGELNLGVTVDILDL